MENLAISPSTFLLSFLFFILIFLCGFVFYFKRCFTYWKLQNVPTIRTCIPFGSFANPLTNRDNQGINIMRMYKQFKEMDAKHGGIYVYSQPGYISLDPEINRIILAKEFHHFTDRGIFVNEKHQPISLNLFSSTADKWKFLRQKLTPTFTSGKMKFMFDIMADCAKSLDDHVGKLSKDNSNIDIKDVARRYSIDVIGSCAFGIQCNSFKSPEAEFVQMAYEVTQPNRKSVKFFTEVVEKTVNYRETNNVRCNDFMQILIDLKNNGELDNTITLTEIVAQAFLFFVAGLATSSNTITLCLFELSQNLTIQRKARNEIKNVLAKYNNQPTYEALKEMVYLQQCIDETLRMYPSLLVFNRECTKDYTFDDGVRIEKGMLVYIPVYGMQTDPYYFPEPKKFDPDRFSKENRDLIKPYSYLPFGAGSRVCIGERFGTMQVKLGLIQLLTNYEYTLHSDTKLPIEFLQTFGLEIKHTILLKARSVKKTS